MPTVYAPSVYAQALEVPDSSDLETMFEAGYAAIFACSSQFIAGRSLEQITNLEITASDTEPHTVAGEPPKFSVDFENKTVSVPFSTGYPPIHAAFREGIGCSVLPWGADINAKDDLPTLSKKRPSYNRDDDQWPETGPIKVAATLKSYAPALEKVVDRVFDPEIYGTGSRTIGVIVLHKGEVVAERYRDGFGPHTQYRTWSTAKSLASAVVGVAIHRGILPDPSTPVSIPEWSDTNDPRRAITLENLLQMASGLGTVVPDVGSATEAAYFAGINSAADATSRPLVHAPGTKFHYSNYDTLLLMRALKAAMGKPQKYLDFPYRRLFDKIGMHNTFAETDAYGNFVMSSQVYTNVRDLARFAYLYLQDGVWEGERILPKGWVRYSCTPTTAEADLEDYIHYGAQWWMYDLTFDPTDGIDDFRICSTNGARGQYAAFSPEHDLVIVRRGIDAWSGDGFKQKRFFEDVVRAVAGKK